MSEIHIDAIALAKAGVTKVELIEGDEALEAKIRELEAALKEAEGADRNSERYQNQVQELEAALLAANARTESERNEELARRFKLTDIARRKAEARAESAEKALRGIEAYMASEESPLYHLWESGDICAYDDNPCDTWEQVLLELRDFSIDPAIIGYGTEWDAVTIYRKILAALSDEEGKK